MNDTKEFIMTDDNKKPLLNNLFSQVSILREAKGLTNKLDTDYITNNIIKLTNIVNELNTTELKLIHDLKVELSLFNLEIDKTKYNIQSMIWYLEETDYTLEDKTELLEQLELLKEANSKLYEEGISNDLDLLSVIDMLNKNHVSDRTVKVNKDLELIREFKTELCLYNSNLDAVKKRILTCLWSIEYNVHHVGLKTGVWDMDYWKQKD